MIKKGMTKIEIEEALKGKGDFVKVDYLERFLKEHPPIDIRKFVFLKLAEVYGNRGMYVEAAKSYENAATASLIFSEKIEFHTKECQNYIKSGDFVKADQALKKAMVEANATQRNEIYIMIKEFYRRQAESYEKSLKRNHAVRIYEKLLLMRISDIEKRDIKEKLRGLYDKLGRIKDMGKLRE
jgi:tetratricopeptide (TPR) repeat protein